ncbi:stage V sporulation protein AB [Paenibacillus algorifonticola]|uniref:Stage V sporulation protein AB n=1 Tax=Paenibacillus algorifonticola TaxID=684063 RepID=A0A1I2EI89_9BACL|nr:stage V sporulation protein AB [Paenibacillus algorifonticola]SFE92357.1 stage V sporulation protein AB [Paenibacillus algorifonticola]
MLDWPLHAFIVLLGLSGGLAVGSGLVALLTVLDIIPRLAQIAYAYSLSIWFETAVISGAVYWTFADFFDWKLSLAGITSQMAAGLLNGIFVGLLAAALTEVLNVFPILAKRIHLSDYLVGLVMAMVLGKTLGSLLDWLWYQW